MSIDYSQSAIPKARPAKLAKQDRARVRIKADEAESEQVKARSGGRCEVHWRYAPPRGRTLIAARCQRRACHVHHMLGGIGVRARGKSALAIHKQHVCSDCHSDITGHVLRRVGGDVPLWTDSYERVE